MVLVAAELSPADVVSLDPRAVTAVATALGAPLSHAAILARSLGIPAVTGLGAAVLGIPSGTVVLVDGDAGTVRINPSDEEVEAARRRQVTDRGRQEEVRRLASTPAVTRDGRTIPVLVNVGSTDDARLAMAEGADGVGMLRTEFTFLGRQAAAPGEGAVPVPGPSPTRSGIVRSSSAHSTSEPTSRPGTPSRG